MNNTLISWLTTNHCSTQVRELLYSWLIHHGIRVLVALLVWMYLAFSFLYYSFWMLRKTSRNYNNSIFLCFGSYLLLFVFLFQPIYAFSWLSFWILAFWISLPLQPLQQVIWSFVSFAILLSPNKWLTVNNVKYVFGDLTITVDSLTNALGDTKNGLFLVLLLLDSLHLYH